MANMAEVLVETPGGRWREASVWARRGFSQRHDGVNPEA